MATTGSMTRANKETPILKTDKSARDSPELVYFGLFSRIDQLTVMLWFVFILLRPLLAVQRLSLWLFMLWEQSCVSLVFDRYPNLTLKCMNAAVFCSNRFKQFLSFYWKSIIVTSIPIILLPIFISNDTPVSVHSPFH